jgi:hypothetical protein
VKRPATSKPATYFVVSARISKATATSPEVACRKVEKANPRHGALCGRSVALRTAQDAEAVLGTRRWRPGPLLHRCHTSAPREEDGVPVKSSSTIIQIFHPPLRPSRLAPLPEAELGWKSRDAIAATLRAAQVRVALAGAVNAAFVPLRRAPKGRP